MTVSNRFELKKEDLVKVGKNALVFAMPALLVLLGDAVKAVPESWTYGALVLYVLNLIMDVLRKWASVNKYK